MERSRNGVQRSARIPRAGCSRQCLRDALRLLAAIQRGLPTVEGEVNLVDLIRYCALESQVPFSLGAIAASRANGDRGWTKRTEKAAPSAQIGRGYHSGHIGETTKTISRCAISCF